MEWNAATRVRGLELAAQIEKAIREDAAVGPRAADDLVAAADELLEIVEAKASAVGLDPNF